jgi:SARP family transcriptional regulator, regulator of embCAB operon
MLSIKVETLGPLRARAGAVDLIPRPQQQRQVFALLAMSAGRMVGLSELNAELWDGEPPHSALTVVQTYVVALRKRLASALECKPRDVSSEILVTHPEGYSLRIDRDMVDAYRFDRQVRLGSRMLAAGRPGEAANHLHQALDLWRGPVLADVRPGRVLDLDVTGLTLARQVAVEQRIEADLALGRHYEVLAELADLTARHRMDEKLHQHYMVALYRTGRRTKALEVYHRLRAGLSTELGLEPSRRAQHLHQAILRADPELDGADLAVA